MPCHVNAVAPGLVLGTEFFGDVVSDERRQRIIAETSLSRSASPAEISAAIRHLVSAEASYVTGEVLHVSGGQLFAR